VNRAINALPFELHIPGYQFCGPGTRLKKRLARGERGINPLDEACREHDLAYARSNDLTERHAADKELAKRAGKRVFARDSGLRERAAAAAVWTAMKAKTKLGMGMTTRRRITTKRLKRKRKTNQRKRVLPTAKRGGMLPIIPILGALGSLVGGAASIAKAVNERKAMQRQERATEGRGVHLGPYNSGRGLYLKPYKYGKGVRKGRGRKKKTSSRR